PTRLGTAPSRAQPLRWRLGVQLGEGAEVQRPLIVPGPDHLDRAQRVLQRVMVCRQTPLPIRPVRAIVVIVLAAPRLQVALHATSTDALFLFRRLVLLR